MKATPTALKAHMAGDLTTLATLWRVTRRDGQVFGFTDHDQPINYGGVMHEASTGYTASAVRTSAALDVDNLDVEGILSSATITDADLIAGLWDYAAFTILRVNYLALNMGHETMRAGTLGNAKTGRQNFTIELRGMMQPLQQHIGRIYTAACDADLGDSRCGITLAGVSVTGAVTAVTSPRAFTDTARLEVDNYFNYGLLTWLTGGNSGYSIEVKTHAAGAFVLQQAMTKPITVGDTYSVHAGCDKMLETCKTKFNNVIRFRGFPAVPGNDRMVSGQ